MSSSAAPKPPPPNDDKPPRLRWREEPEDRRGVLRAPWQVPIVFTIFSLWNFLLPPLTRRNPTIDAFTLVGIAAGLFFGYLALRGFWNTTRVRFAAGKFTVVTGPLWPRARVEHSLVDIKGFVAEADPTKQHHGHVVSLVTRADARLPLPLRLNGFTLTMKGSNTPFMGVAPPEHAAYLARRLEELLEDARREGGQYRIAPGLSAVAREPAHELEHEESAEQRARR